MINTVSPKPNWPSCRPNRDNILEPAKKKATRLAKKIPHAALAKGSLRASAGVIVPGSVGANPNIAMVLARGNNNSQPLQSAAAMNIWKGTRKRNTKFHNLFWVNQPDFLADAGIFRFVVFAVTFFVKSSMSTCNNYWFKTYSLIISKSYDVLKLIMRVVIVFSLYLQGVCTAATPVNNRPVGDIKRLITRAEIQNKIPRGLLSAIAKVESDHKEYAINVGGRSVYTDSFTTAVSIAKSKINAGITNIDLGVMQLNYRWHGDQFASLEEMLTPEKNINYAASLLKSLYDQHRNWQKAIRHYHSSNLEHSRKYSRKVAMVWLAGK